MKSKIFTPSSIPQMSRLQKSFIFPSLVSPSGSQKIEHCQVALTSREVDQMSPKTRQWLA